MDEPVTALLRGAFPDPRAAAARAREAASRHGSEVQLLRPDVVASPRHVASAAAHARRAVAEGRGRAQSLGAEFLCFLTGQRQVVQALAQGGVRPGATEVLAVALGGKTEEALQAVAEALGARASPFVAQGAQDERPALERVALLDTER